MDPVGIDRPRPRPATGDVYAARQALEDARTRLDAAVSGMAAVDGDEAMATPELLVLLIGAVTAKERLDALEAVVALSGPARDGK
jgi:hypothetical protein